jgi:hypothetical protein
LQKRADDVMKTAVLLPDEGGLRPDEDGSFAA